MWSGQEHFGTCHTTTSIVDSQETHADPAVDARKRNATEKGRQFEIERLKENQKTALANLTKQINVILPLLADFENEKQVKHMICISVLWMTRVKLN